MDFEVIGAINDIERMAVGREIRELARLRKLFGAGRWRKLKGRAMVRIENGTILTAEVHWYEAHGKGRQLIKIKRFLDDVS